MQRRSEADSGAGSRKVVHRCRELEKCLLLRLPLARTLGAAAGGCIGKYVLSLVRPCCRASPLITAFSYPLAEGKRLQTSQIAKKMLRFLKIAFDKEQFFKRWFFCSNLNALVIYYETGGWNAIFRGAPSPATFPWSQVMSSECQLPAASLYQWNIQQEIGWNVKFWPLCPPCAGLDCRVNYSELPSAFS